MFRARDYWVSAAVIVLGLGGGYVIGRATRPDTAVVLGAGDWLLRAPTEVDRARLLEQQLRGFDVAMWEVSARFGFLHAALVRQNYPFAIYQWDKIETSIRNALVRRPAKTTHAQEYLLGKTSTEIRTGFASGNSAKAWNAFSRAKFACQACHGAEGVAYVNASPTFELSPPKP